MLAALLNAPTTPEEWQTWSWQHRLSHAAILGAAAAKGTFLTDYVLDPIPLAHIDDWLERNQQAHVDMDGLVGVQSVDLTDVDFNDARQVQAWIYLHWQDHTTVEQRLGVGS